MPPSPEFAAKERFQRALVAISRLPSGACAEEVARAAGEFREALLLFGSSSADNLSCIEEFMVGRLEATSPDPSRHGLRLAGRDVISLSQLLWCAEGSPIPGAVRDSFPTLTQEQWDAALRLATLISVAFESS